MDVDVKMAGAMYSNGEHTAVYIVSARVVIDSTHLKRPSVVRKLRLLAGCSNRFAVHTGLIARLFEGLVPLDNPRIGGDLHEEVLRGIGTIQRVVSLPSWIGSL